MTLIESDAISHRMAANVYRPIFGGFPPTRWSSQTCAYIRGIRRNDGNVLFVVPARMEHRSGVPSLGLVRGPHAPFFDAPMVAAVRVVEAHPRVGVGVYLVLH